MKLRIFHKKELEEARLDIYYSAMTPVLERIITLAKGEKLSLYGTDETGRVLLDIDEIMYFDTVDKRTFAYLDRKVCQISRRLAVLEEELRGYGFIRINKSNVVNIYKISCIKPSPNMRVTAVLENQERLVINRNYKAGFEKYLKTMRGVIA